MKTERDQIFELLESIGNSPILKTNEYHIAKNLFPILYNKIREKELMHSESIAFILKESMQNETCNSLFKSLFELMEITEYQCCFEKISIETERRITKDRRIDLLLTWKESNNKYAVIIENKLNNAPDQVNQLSDYYRDIKNEGYEVLKIVYLPASETKRAKEIGDIEADKLLINLYPVNLIDWLENFVQNKIEIDQEYKNIIKGYISILKLTDMENKKIEENFELTRIIGEKENNILNAYKIHERWNDIKWHTEWEFWNDLKKSLPVEFKVLNGQLFSPEYLQNAIHRKQNRNVHYGITIKLNEVKSRLICLYIERGFENMYYGIVVKNINQEWLDKNDEIFIEITKKMESKIEHALKNDKHCSLWVISKIFNEQIDFESFSNESTLKLINPVHREKVIQKCIEEILVLVNQVKPLL